MNLETIVYIVARYWCSEVDILPDIDGPVHVGKRRCIEDAS